MAAMEDFTMGKKSNENRACGSRGEIDKKAFMAERMGISESMEPLGKDATWIDIIRGPKVREAAANEARRSRTAAKTVSYTSGEQDFATGQLGDRDRLQTPLRE
jgi:hypothetical protein